MGLDERNLNHFWVVDFDFLVLDFESLPILDQVYTIPFIVT